MKAYSYACLTWGKSLNRDKIKQDFTQLLKHLNYVENKIMTSKYKYYALETNLD